MVWGNVSALHRRGRLPSGLCGLPGILEEGLLGVIGGGPHAFAWVFDPSKPTGSRWIFDVNSENYVFKVMEHFDAL